MKGVAYIIYLSIYSSIRLSVCKSIKIFAVFMMLPN